jgi:hypothetical protein
MNPAEENRAALPYEIHVSGLPDGRFIGEVFDVDFAKWTSAPQKTAAEAFEVAEIARNKIVAAAIAKAEDEERSANAWPYSRENQQEENADHMRRFNGCRG